jgi:hypothetical protein
METLKRRRQTWPPSREECAWAAGEITRATVGLTEGGLRLDWHVLDDSETERLVKLTRKATEGGGFDYVGRLSKSERNRWESLVERASGAEGIFAKHREQAAFHTKVGELHRKTVARPILRREEPGLIAEIASHVEGGYLEADHLTALMLVLVALQTGKPLLRTQRIEAGADGPLLVLDSTMGFVGGDIDPEAHLSRWPVLLAHLERNGWLTLARKGSELKVGLGSRTQKALGKGGAR